MKRIIIVYNPRSSRFADVKSEVLSKIKDLGGYLVGKYEVKPTDLEDNILQLSKLLKDDDLVISAGGDATGIISSNAVLKSDKDATLAVLPYGNFNDLSRTLRTTKLEDIVCHTNPASRQFYPLEIIVDGKFFRYATCYVTIGMTAEAVYIYDEPKMRKKLKKHFGRNITSYTSLVGWYIKNRRKKQFLPEFKLNGVLQSVKISDYAAVNGKSMARVMKGGEDYHDSEFFRSKIERLVNPYRLLKLMVSSIFSRIPGTPTKGDILEFTRPATVTLQAEGESKIFKDIKTIEIRKAKKCLKVIEN